MRLYQDIRRGLFKAPQDRVSFFKDYTNVGTIGPYTLCPTYRSTMSYDVVVQPHDNSFVSVRHVNVKVVAPGTNVRIEDNDPNDPDGASFGTEVYAGIGCHVRCGEFAKVVCGREAVVQVGSCSKVTVGIDSRVRGGEYTCLVLERYGTDLPVVVVLSKEGEYEPDTWYHIVDSQVTPWSP